MLFAQDVIDWTALISTSPMTAACIALVLIFLKHIREDRTESKSERAADREDSRAFHEELTARMETMTTAATGSINKNTEAMGRATAAIERLESLAENPIQTQRPGRVKG